MYINYSTIASCDENNARTVTSIIKELQETKIAECNEIRKTLN